MAAKLSAPDTGAGTVVVVVVPLPSWPYVFKPQQYAAPLVVMPQVLVQPLPVVSLLPALGDRRPQGGELRSQRLDLSRLLPSPPLEGLDRQQVDPVDVRGGDGRIALAEPEGGVEVLRRGAEVADRGVLRLVVPLLNWHAGDLLEHVDAVHLA